MNVESKLHQEAEKRNQEIKMIFFIDKPQAKVQSKSQIPIKMCLCDCESLVGNPLHNSKFKFRACPYRPRRSSFLFIWVEIN